MTASRCTYHIQTLTMDSDRPTSLDSATPCHQGVEIARREHQVLWGSISLLLLVALAVNLPVLQGHLALTRTQYRDFSPVRLVTQSITLQHTSISQRQRYIPVPSAILGDLRHIASPLAQTVPLRGGSLSVQSLLHALIDLPPPLSA